MHDIPFFCRFFYRVVFAARFSSWRNKFDTSAVIGYCENTVTDEPGCPSSPEKFPTEISGDVHPEREAFNVIDDGTVKLEFRRTFPSVLASPSSFKWHGKYCAEFRRCQPIVAKEGEWRGRKCQQAYFNNAFVQPPGETTQRGNYSQGVAARELRKVSVTGPTTPRYASGPNNYFIFD